MTDNGAGWRKSSHSGNNGGACVEVGGVALGVMVRDTTDRAGAVLSVSAGAWQALLVEVRVSR
jgi:hypothetical protein